MRGGGGGSCRRFPSENGTITGQCAEIARKWCIAKHLVLHVCVGCILCFSFGHGTYILRLLDWMV